MRKLPEQAAGGSTKDAVLISIHRKWVEKIASGEKVLEIRKNFPKLEPPFRCYVYEAKRGGGRGAVVMEFECSSYVYCIPSLWDKSFCNAVAKAACLNLNELLEYSGRNKIIGWVIKQVKAYDKAKDTLEFGINRIPQSWCYVEEVL